jgi:hypothetical protein
MGFPLGSGKTAGLQPIRMSPSSTLRSLLPPGFGLVVGVLGTVLFLNSRPAPEGSAEARVQTLEVELERARTRIAALEETRPRTSKNPIQTVFDRGREIAQRLRDGRPVSSEELYRAAQPVLRDFAPLFERMINQKSRRHIDTEVGELTRTYHLDARQQGELATWFRRKSEAETRRWIEALSSENSSFFETMKLLNLHRMDDGLDPVMEKMLSGDQLETFKADRLQLRADRVQNYADMRVQRIHQIVDLDAQQTDQLFGIMAQASPDYDPSIRLEGFQGEIRPSGVTPREAMLSVLRPDQRERYEFERERLRSTRMAELAELGLTIPENWDELDADP